MKVGFSRPFIDASNASTYAERYDVIYGAIPDSHIDTLRAINPSIILLQYALPGGEKNESRYPDSSYVKDVASRLKVLNRHKYYLLNFGDPGVRAARRDSIIKPRVDGYWLDTAGPIWVNSPFFGWRDEAGKMADVGNLDGSWDPSMAESTKDSFTDGTWPGYMLAFHQELKAAQPGKLIIFNGMAGNPTRQATWGSIQQTYLSATYGAGHEFFFVERDGPVPERLWKWQLDRAQAILTSGKYMHVFTYRLWEHQKYAFASYLLIADGKYAWFNVYSDLYDPSLHEVDYGAPTGVYQTISTASGPIYKRLFTNATVWVNPGDVTRSGDGKSIRPKSAIIELR